MTRRFGGTAKEGLPKQQTSAHRLDGSTGEPWGYQEGGQVQAKGAANTPAWLCPAWKADGAARSEGKRDAAHAGPARLMRILPLVGEEATGRL